MQEYENFLEFGLLMPADDKIIDNIESELKAYFPHSEITPFDHFVAPDTLGWTIGINDGYEDQLMEITSKYPRLPFLSKALDNEEVVATLYLNKKQQSVQTPIVLPINSYGVK